MKRKKRRPRRPTGRPELSEQLAEAHAIEGLPLETPADLDPDEVQAHVQDLKRLVPAEAYVPDDLDDEKSLVFEIPRSVKR